MACDQFMLRLKNPCGKVDPSTYKCIDDLSEKYGQQDLRATTRQAFQVREKEREREREREREKRRNLCLHECWQMGGFEAHTIHSV